MIYCNVLPNLTYIDALKDQAMTTQEAFVYASALVIFMKIVCFILGFLTVRLGYKLIKAGVSGQFKFSANLGGFKTDLASVSPGLLFVLLGVILIGYAMHVEKDVHVKGSGMAAPDLMDFGR